jgi:hypothetical protein
MSVSSEVKRTLVKSPPELWAELSDPATLARHLGELGEVTIVRTEPEQAVDWEAPQVSGTVRIEPSGWGTKVTLTAIQSLESTAFSPQGEDQQAKIEESQGTEEFEVQGTEEFEEIQGIKELEPDLEPELDLEPVFEVWPPATAEVEPQPAAEAGPRRGFFARLFRRQPKIQPPPQEPIELEPLPVVPAPEPAATMEPVVDLEPVPTIEPRPIADLEPMPTIVPEPAGEPELSREREPDESPSEQTDIEVEIAQLEEQTTAVLVSVLDRLGAAHHRPFSRA